MSLGEEKQRGALSTSVNFCLHKKITHCYMALDEDEDSDADRDTRDYFVSTEDI